jgi:molybdopterin-containing oxidoreductase family membrane subunit
MNGLAVTNMSNMFNWGFYIASFAFLVGVAAGGMIISSCIYLFKAESLKPFGLIASLSAFACACGAGLMVLVDLGSIQNILNIIIHPNFSSPLVWDVIVITCYIILTLLSVIFQLKARSDDEQKAASAKKTARIVALVALPFAIGIHTVTALIFATQNGHEWWHTAVLPPDFIAMAVASGGSLVLILAMAFSDKGKTAEHMAGYRTIARIIAGALAVHFFFTAMELILAAWTGSVETQALLNTLFGSYGLLYAAELIMPAVAMVMFFTKAGTASKGVLYGGAVLVLLGTLAHRMMLLFPAFSESNMSFNVLTANGMMNWLYPVSTGRMLDGSAFATMYSYAPTGIEYLVALLPIGLALALIAFVNYRYKAVVD